MCDNGIWGFEDDEYRGNFKAIKVNWEFEDRSFILFPLLRVGDGNEHGVATIIFSKIDIKRKTITEMQSRKLIHKFENKCLLRWRRWCSYYIFNSDALYGVVF